jgi:hypothetical protein
MIVGFLFGIAAFLAGNRLSMRLIACVDEAFTKHRMCSESCRQHALMGRG